MIRYIPFLKAKQNELKAMSELCARGEESDLSLLRLPPEETI